LSVDHGAEATQVFEDARLHTFVGGDPATEEERRARYTRQVGGRSPDGGEA
jgi:hypothetical protein